MIEYLLAPPVAVITSSTIVMGFVLVAILIIATVLLLTSIIQKDSLYMLGITSTIGVLAFFVLFSGIYKSYDPLPKYTKETCVLVYDGAYPIKPYKSTTTYAVGMKTYKNTKNDDTFTILASHGKVYPKEIVCYRVERSN